MGHKLDFQSDFPSFFIHIAPYYQIIKYQGIKILVHANASVQI